jgi:hypothetical protein
MQVFEDIESKFTHTTSTTENLLVDNEHNTDIMSPPLLVMIYEFERGQGTMEMSTVDTTTTFDFLSSDNIVPALTSIPSSSTVDM